MIKGQKAIQFNFCNLLHSTCATEVLYSFDSYVALNKFSLFSEATFIIFSACVDLVLYYWTTSAFLDLCHCVVLVMLTFWCFISIQSTKCISVIWRPVFVFFVVIGCCELTGVIIPTRAQWDRKNGKDCHQDLTCAVDSWRVCLSPPRGSQTNLRESADLRSQGE